MATAPAATLGTTKRAIVDRLKRVGAATVPELADALDLTTAGVRQPTVKGVGIAVLLIGETLRSGRGGLIAISIDNSSGPSMIKMKHCDINHDQSA